MSLDIRVHDTPAAAVEAFCTALVEARPRTFVLTGGGTAGDAYRLLASEEWRERLPWRDMTLLFGDERCVPPDSEESNYRLVSGSLLQGVEPGRVERMRGEAPDREAEATRYAALIPEVLDFTMLGMGADGHCASLFPGEPVLDVTDRLCVPSRGHYPPWDRLTLTFPALDRSRLAAFLVTGESKADALGAIARGEDRPAGRVRPPDGQVVWFVDRAAAAQLP